MTVPLAPLNGEIILPGNGVTVILAPHPLRADRRIAVIDEGRTVREIVDMLSAGQDRFKLVAWLGAEHRIPEAVWHRVRPKAGTVLVLHAVARGEIGRSIALIAVAIASFLFAPLIGAALGLGAIGIGLIGAAITIGGTFLVNKLLPLRPKELEDTSRKQIATITGARNVAAPYDPIPVILGRTRVFPRLGAQTYTERVGDDQYLRMLVVWGYGPLDITSIKIGETLLSAFDDVEIETFYGYPSDADPTLFPKTPFEEQLSIELEVSVENTRTTAPDINEFSIDLTAPQGLYTQKKKDGSRSPRTVQIMLWHRAYPGGGAWTLWGTVTFTANSIDLKRVGVRKAVARGQYEIKVQRLTALYTGTDNIVQEDIYWTALRGFRNDPPISFSAPLAISAIRVKATGQLSGVIDDLNGIVTSRVTAWDGNSWEDDTPSQNPADLFRAVLQHPANARPVADTLIDLDTLAEWWAYCDDEGFEFNQERAGRTSVYETLADIAAAGRAVPVFVDGKWSVMWDQPDASVVWHFTPRNSWGFKGTRAYAIRPHGFRVRFQNENKEFREDERVVYDDGYSAANATRLESIEFPGVTDPALIWRHGRFHIAQARLRPEIYEIMTDFEFLRFTRGDRVRLTHDVALLGLVSGRVKEVNGNVITLDEVVTMESATDYGIRFRLADGTSLYRSVVTAAGEANEVEVSGSEALPEAGDLFAFGEAEQESVIMRVLSVEPQDDLTARVQLVDDAPEISEADTGTIPDFESNITIPPDPFTLPPRDLRISEFFSAISGGVRAGVYLSWQVPRTGLADRYEVQYRQEGIDAWTPGGTVAVPQTEARIYDLEAGAYDFRVRTIFRDGKASDWVTLLSQSLVGLSAPPPDVTTFRMALTGDTATLTWNAVDSVNVKGYEIRYSPSVVATWNNAAALFDEIVPGTSVPIVPRAGSYLIKAVSYQDVQSVNAKALVSTAEALSNFNAVEIVEETGSDSPAFPGDHDGTVYDSDLGGVRLEASPDEGLFARDGFFAPARFFFGEIGVEGTGRYTLAETVDLGEVFTSRVTWDMLVSGVDLLDSIFDRLDIFSLTDIFGDDPTVWSAYMELRYTEDDPAGSPVTWSDWERFVAGDFTARGYQFRIVLTSTDYSITPVVTEVSVTIDMPDRTIGGKDITVTVAGLTVPFDPPFRELTGVGTVDQDLDPGDYKVISAKSETGFHIQFFDDTDTPVERTFDFVATGYGRVVT